MMNTIIYSQENKIKNSANLFNKNFNNYLEQLSSLIKKKIHLITKTLKNYMIIIKKFRKEQT